VFQLLPALTVVVFNRSAAGGASEQASLFAQFINKDIISMNNVQGQAARKAHKAQHCWPPCKKLEI